MKPINKEQWISEIKRLAKEEFGFTGPAVDQTDWEAYWDTHGSDSTPTEALEENLRDA